MVDTDSAPEAGQAGETVVAETTKPEAAEAGKTRSVGEAFEAAWKDGQAEEAAEAEKAKAATEAPDGKAAATEGEGKGSAPPAKATDAPAGQEKAPEDWSDAERSAYGRLPKDAQAQVMRLYKSFQAGFTRKSQELSDAKRFSEAVQEVVAPFKADLMQEGIEPVEGIRRLTQLHAFAKRDPVGYAKWFMQAAGLKPEQLGFTPEGAAAASEQETPYADPALAKVSTGLAEVQQWQRTEMQRRADEAKQAIAAEMQAFLDAKDEAGQPRHPHYERVKGVMAQLIRSDATRTMTLDQAYERAVWGDPELRRGLQEAEVTKALDAKRKADQEAAEKAKTAGRTLQAAPGVAHRTGRKSIRQAMAEAEAELG